ncbi:MAG: serine dehydratase, partial [Cyclobacteriaceae bacterium]
MNFPSIFNDVVGPVMRGPSSSHCAASLRIGRICHDLMQGSISSIEIDFDPAGSLATTHKEQGSDMGLFGGFLGWEAYDERLVHAEQHMGAAGIQVKINIKDIQAVHPNTYKITLTNPWETHQVIAISTGGGMIEVIEIDGAKVSFAGDSFLTLIYTTDPESAQNYLQHEMFYDSLELRTGDQAFVELKSQQIPDASLLQDLREMEAVSLVKQIRPVLPVLTKKNQKVPFITCDEMMAYNKEKNLSLWDLAVRYESIRGNIPEEDVLSKMNDIRKIVKD